MDKMFDPAAVEARIRALWDEADAFKAGRPDRADATPYTVMLPPPNVTGSLHIGHALDHSLQDILCRFERMRGRDVLWQPGMDHAGIATQMVVERQLADRQQPDRRSMGRDAFVERVWAWKEESGGQILGQMRRLGASCDWSRTRFTMDEGLSEAVSRVFVQLYRETLIYRAKRLVNWDPKLLTAVSDIEVMQVELKGSLWHFQYPIEGEAGRTITVATTRPETMLGDTAVAVHPDDERYADLVGRFAVLPLVGRRIPIVADPYADPGKGSGAVKITPAHDFNDFEVGRRHDLPLINVLDQNAAVTLEGNAAFLDGIPRPGPAVMALHGLSREEARRRVVALMEGEGRLQAVEPHVHAVPHGDRSNAVIEPWLTDQWYVDAATLAKPALAAVREGRTVFTPKSWEKTYFDWLDNIQPWCVSRQLWWGHRIPAWYGPDGAVFVAGSEAEAAIEAVRHYGAPVELRRDEDVLDTWFSSALWPFSTLGWPDETPELARYYPTSTLVTGFDIIFFWVARMMMMGLHFTGEVPFADVYMHALVRDEKGAKMSKSKGNVIDPLTLIDDYGADALRFTLAALAVQGRDIRVSAARVDSYRGFVTKLWQAARFAEINGCDRQAGFEPDGVRDPLNRWIVAETRRAAGEVTAALEAFRFNDAAGSVYRFVWNVFCDWHIELAKPVLTGGEEVARAETRATTAWVLDEILALLHPFMPFVTEELWAIKGEAGPPRTSLLALAPWPKGGSLPGERDAAVADVAGAIALISDIRSVRSELNVPAAAQIPLVLAEGADLRPWLERWGDTLKRLARLSAVTVGTAPSEGAVPVAAPGIAGVLPLAGVIDILAERARLGREIGKVEADARKTEAKLANADFVARAPEEVIEENRERLADAKGRLATLGAALARLG